MEISKNHQSEQDQYTKSIQELSKPEIISAKTTNMIPEKISQCDIFEKIEIIENLQIDKSLITVEKISFPYIICLNQACDLESDYKNHINNKNKDNQLLHLLVAPVFIYDQYKSGTHWGDIFNCDTIKKDTLNKIKQNDISRYHYLKFPQNETNIPELLIDFKHFFSVNRNFLYTKINMRLCSLDHLFREKISQRFSYYLSRIGLPEYTTETDIVKDF